MGALVVTLAAALAVLVLLLAVPVSLTAHVERDEGWRLRWRLRWLFGLVYVRSRARGRERRRPERPPDADAPRSRARRRPGPATLVAAARTPGFAARVCRLLADLQRRIGVDGFYLRTEFGFDDPADTGIVFGVMTPWLLAAHHKGYDVRVQPDFASPRFAGALGASVHLRPVAVVAVVSAFLCAPPTLRALRAAWRARR